MATKPKIGRPSTLTKKMVFDVADRLVAENRAVSPYAIRTETGTGSLPVIADYLDEWRAARPALSPESRVPTEVRDALMRVWVSAEIAAEERSKPVRDAAFAERDAALKSYVEIKRECADLTARVAVLETSLAKSTQTLNLVLHGKFKPAKK